MKTMIFVAITTLFNCALVFAASNSCSTELKRFININTGFSCGGGNQGDTVYNVRDTTGATISKNNNSCSATVPADIVEHNPSSHQNRSHDSYGKINVKWQLNDINNTLRITYPKSITCTSSI